MRIKIIIIFLIFALKLYGVYEDIGKEARAKGMGNAFYAEPAGILSMYYNPAGTAFTKKIEVSGNFGLPYTGFETIDFKTFNGAFLYPFTYHLKSEMIFKNGVFGIGFNNLSHYYENSEYDSDDDIYYYERLIKINISKDLLDIIGPGTRFGVGINFNIFMRGLDGNIDTKANGGYFINGLKTSGIGIDLGFIYVMNVNMILGFSIDNLIEPNVAFNKDLAEEAVEKNYKIGLSWKKERLWRFKYVTIAGGVSFENLKSDVWEYRIGYEFWEFDRVMGIRIGYETSDRGMNILGLGLTGRKSFGWQSSHEIEVNYGFNIPIVGIKDTYGNHTFSIVYRYRMPEYVFEFDRRKRIPMRERYEKEKMEEKIKELSKEKEVGKVQTIQTQVGQPVSQQSKPAQKSIGVQQTSVSSQPPSTQQVQTMQAGEIKIHIIGEGDNLMKISKMYYGSNKYWQKLAEYNGLKPPNYPFKVGQELKIPPVSELEK
jgi:hypothetical protein